MIENVSNFLKEIIQTNRLYEVEFDSDHYETDRNQVPYSDRADVVSSESNSQSGVHEYLLLDLDTMAELIPSSTTGHFHFYAKLKYPSNTKKYMKFLDAAADIGLIDRNYAAASRHRGASMLRLPWVKKTKV